MSGLFGGGAPATPPPPPPAPSADTQAIERRDEAARDERIRRASVGRASTILTGGTGVTEEAPSARKVLTGG